MTNNSNQGNLEDTDAPPAADLLTCGNRTCGWIDATMKGCPACGASAEDMAGWYK